MNIVDLIVFLVFSVGTIVFGYFLGYRKQSSDEFTRGGSLLLQLDFVSGILLVGVLGQLERFCVYTLYSSRGTAGYALLRAVLPQSGKHQRLQLL